MSDYHDEPANAGNVIRYLNDMYYARVDVALAALNLHREELTTEASTRYVGDVIADAMGWRMLPDPSVPGDGFWPWETQAKQHPERNDRGGIVYRVDTVVVGTVDRAGEPQASITTTVETLLHYSRAGTLNGILHHYPETIVATMPDGKDMELERAGNISMWVKPSRRRRGVGSRLLAAAERRWRPDWFAQTYTAAGHALIKKHLRSDAYVNQGATR